MVKRLEDLRIYKISEEIADKVWFICTRWSIFARMTVGRQFVRAVDSIGANITEGHGRYHYKENITFLYYARGSLVESRFWIKRSYKRRLISKKIYNEFTNTLEELAPQLNAYINSIRKSTNAK